MKLHKKLLITAILAGILLSPSAYAMNNEVIQLPDPATLTQRLKEKNFKHLMDNCPFIEELADQDMLPLDVVRAIEALLHGYVQKINNPAIARQMNYSKRILIRVVLQDHPEAIAELKRDGILT